MTPVVLVWLAVVVAIATRLALIGEVNRHSLSWGDAYLSTVLSWLYWLVIAMALHHRSTGSMQGLSRRTVALSTLPIALGAIVWSSLAENILLPGSPPVLSLVSKRLLPEILWQAAIFICIYVWFKNSGDGHTSAVTKPHSITLKVGSQNLVLKAADIILVQSQDYYSEVVTNDKKHLVREPVYSLSNKLEPLGFVRINRSAIVNLSAVSRFGQLAKFGYGVEMQDGTRFKIGKTYREVVARRLENMVTHL